MLLHPQHTLNAIWQLDKYRNTTEKMTNVINERCKKRKEILRKRRDNKLLLKINKYSNIVSGIPQPYGPIKFGLGLF